MMITNNKFYSFIFSIFHLFNSLDATVKCNNKLKIIFSGKIDSLKRYTITFIIAVGIQRSI